MLNVAQGAARLGVDESTIRKWARQNKLGLPGIRIRAVGGRVHRERVWDEELLVEVARRNHWSQRHRDDPLLDAD